MNSAPCKAERDVRPLFPTVSLSFGQSFFTNDPRTGDGSFNGTPVSRAHSYQLVVSKYLGATELRANFGRITQEASLAKIDPGTGLEYNEGPSRNRYMTVAVRRRFNGGSLEASFSKAMPATCTMACLFPKRRA